MKQSITIEGHCKYSYLASDDRGDPPFCNFPFDTVRGEWPRSGDPATEPFGTNRFTVEPLAKPFETDVFDVLLVLLRHTL